MNRRLQRHHDDNTTSEWWVNSTHVVAVFPHRFNARLCYVETIRDTVLVVGAAGDVARELNGYFDE